jgi:hypothetical protein
VALQQDGVVLERDLEAERPGLGVAGGAAATRQRESREERGRQ